MEKHIGIAIFFLLICVWQAHAAVNCTSSGRFAEPTDATCKNYTLCVLNVNTNAFAAYNYVCPTTSLFNPNTAQCTAPTNYNCSLTNATPTTTVCTADGFVADPSSTDCSTYIQCVQIDGVFTQTTLTCPAPSLYNPATTLCEIGFNCTTAATCTQAGRFAVTADTTCQTYNLCVRATDGTFTQYLYTCPTTSLFNPTTRLCTTTYTCPS